MGGRIPGGGAAPGMGGRGGGIVPGGGMAPGGMAPGGMGARPAGGGLRGRVMSGLADDRGGGGIMGAVSSVAGRRGGGPGGMGGRFEELVIATYPKELRGHPLACQVGSSGEPRLPFGNGPVWQVTPSDPLICLGYRGNLT